MRVARAEGGVDAEGRVLVGLLRCVAAEHVLEEYCARSEDVRAAAPRTAWLGERVAVGDVGRGAVGEAAPDEAIQKV